MKMGRDARPTVDPCEVISPEKPVGTALANVFHSTAQAKIMVSSGGTRGSLSNQKRIFNELQHGKPVVPDEIIAPVADKKKPPHKAKTNDKTPKKKKKSPAARKQPKPVSNLSISTKDRISIEPLDRNNVPPRVEAKLGLRSIRILHKFITNSSKITLNVRHHEPVTMKLFQGYGDQERETGTLISY